MALINLLILISIAFSAEELLPKFLTKQPLDTLRFLSFDGRYAYVQRKPGVLGLVSSFRNYDFVNDHWRSDFLVNSSRFKQRIVIETVPSPHQEFSLLKNHKIAIVDYGNYHARNLGQGRNPRLHLQDEWITYYDMIERILYVENLVTSKKYKIDFPKNGSVYYIPDVEMVSADTVIYTGINEKGFSTIVKFNLATQKATVMYRSSLNATKIELCQEKGYLAVGEFPFEGATRGSKIMQIKLTASTNLAGFETIYEANSQDLGQMICLESSIYFIKTIKQHKKLNTKTTEVAKLDLATNAIQLKTAIENVTQLVNMDGRVLIPYRGEFYVLEGTSNLSEDKLKAAPTDKKEELPLDI